MKWPHGFAAHLEAKTVKKRVQELSAFCGWSADAGEIHAEIGSDQGDRIIDRMFAAE
jgi:hypothetical protein